MNELIVSIEPKYQVQKAAHSLNLSANAKLLIIILDENRNAKTGDPAYLTKKKIAKLLNLSERQASRVVKELSDAGFVIVVDRYIKRHDEGYSQTSNLYYLTKLILSPANDELKQKILALPPRASTLRPKGIDFVTAAKMALGSIIKPFSRKAKCPPPVVMDDIPYYPLNIGTPIIDDNNFITTIEKSRFENNFTRSKEADEILERYKQKIADAPSHQRDSFKKSYINSDRTLKEMLELVDKCGDDYWLKATTLSPNRLFKDKSFLPHKASIEAKVKIAIQRARDVGRSLSTVLELPSLKDWFLGDLEAMKQAVEYLIDQPQLDAERNARLREEARAEYWKRMEQYAT